MYVYDYDGQTCERFAPLSPYTLSLLPAPLVLSSRSGPSISFAVCPSLSLNISLLSHQQDGRFFTRPAGRVEAPGYSLGVLE